MTRLAKLYLFRRWAINYNREKVSLPDGGTVALDWASRESHIAHSELADDAPTIILFHGLVGDSQSEYIFHLTWHLMEAGYRVAVMIARGCGDLELTSCASFIGKKENDVHCCIVRVKKRYPRSKLFFLGFSLGAASTLNYLAEFDSRNCKELTAAMCISPPWNMQLQQGDRWLMNLWFILLVMPVKAYIFRHYGVLGRVQDLFRHYEKDVSLLRILSVKDMAELDRVLFHTYNVGHHDPDGAGASTSAAAASVSAYAARHDDSQKGDASSVSNLQAESTLDSAAAQHLLTAAAKGKTPTYTTVEDYYRDVSPQNVAHLITTPTLAVSACDDPICMIKHCPTDPDRLGPGLVVVKTQYGGHLAFPEGVLPLTRAWTDKLVVEWFNKFR